MKLNTFFILITVTLSLLFVACGNKKHAAEEEQPVAVSIGDTDLQVGDFPEMFVEVTEFDGFSLTAGDKISGHYDMKKGCWICDNENGAIFETSPTDDSKYALFRIKGKDGIGLIENNTGKIVVLPKYVSLQLGFLNGFCMVQNDDFKGGLISEEGKIVLPLIYDDIWYDEIIDGLVKVSKDDLQGFVNLQGETVIPFKYEILEQGGEGMIWFMQKPQRWGCLNYENKIIVQPEFTHTAPFVDGVAKAQKDDAEYYFIYTDGRVEKYVR